MADPRRTFAPVLLLGLASGALSAVAGTKPWAQLTDTDLDAASGTPVSELAYADAGQMPLAGALSLVVLAAWGVVLVTRGRVRQVVAGLGVLASLGVLATVVVGFSSTQDELRTTFRDVGATSVDTGPSGWFWAAAASAVLSLVATALAVRYVRHWPAMGSRYDAPSARPAAAAARAGGRAGDRADRTVDPEEAAEGELWRAIDEGHDPTT